MENRNGQGIFLGVVGVATLVVAIIGATFAFFSAQVAGDNNVEAQSYRFATTLGVSEVSGKANADLDGKLIPLLPDRLSSALTGSNGKQCVDKAGYDACEIYQLTFTNSGSAPVNFKGVLTITSNGFTADTLQLVEFGANTEQTLTGLSSVTSPKTTALPKTGSVNLEDITVDVGTTTIYIAVYLKDTTQNQPNDQNVSFAGTVTYTSADGGNLTATFA